jgi:hypothetical protein
VLLIPVINLEPVKTTATIILTGNNNDGNNTYITSINNTGEIFLPVIQLMYNTKCILLFKQVVIDSEPLLLTKQSSFLSVQLPYSLLRLFSLLTCLSYSIFNLYRSLTVLIQLRFVSPLMLTVLHVCSVFSSIETSRGKERFVTCIQKLTTLWSLPWKLLKTVGNTASAGAREYCTYPVMLGGLRS